MCWVEHQHIQCVFCCSRWGCVVTCHIFYVITIAASRWERRSVGDPGVPLLYYSLCFYYADTYQVLSAFMLFTASRRGWRRVGDQCDPSCIILCVIIIWNLLLILLFTASRWGWRRRRVGDPCVSSLHLHQSTGLCKYWVVKYWSLYVLSNYSMPTDSLIKILTHNPLKQYIVKYWSL